MKLQLLNDFLSLIYPNNCAACGNSLFAHEMGVCTACIRKMEESSIDEKESKLEQIFWGQVQLEEAISLTAFSKGYRIQKALHQLKYDANKEVGLALGKRLGRLIKNSERFSGIDLIVPVPLTKKKQTHRGFNQSEIIAKGVSEVLGVPVNTKLLVRKQSGTSQTRKNRLERYQLATTVFILDKTQVVEAQNILLVDDVITTGATAITCVEQLNKLGKTKVSLATIAYV